MNREAEGAVSLVELQEAVADLRALAARAADAGQGTFHFVLATAAESLSDNVDMAVEIDADVD